MINPNEILNYMRVYSDRTFSAVQVANHFDIPLWQALITLDKLEKENRISRKGGTFRYTGD